VGKALKGRDRVGPGGTRAAVGLPLEKKIEVAQGTHVRQVIETDVFLVQHGQYVRNCIGWGDAKDLLRRRS